ncbi:cobaltochelatase subunit CobT, partial [Marinicauda algicola]
KRALSAATRSIARDRELEVRFGGEVAGIVKGRALLPNPTEDIDEATAAKLRGKADAIALRLALHDSETHAGALPPGTRGQQIFEAAEQARCEAPGARAMKG